MRGRYGKCLVLGIAMLGLSMSAAVAARVPGNATAGSSLSYPGQPRPVYDDQKLPYAMNYTDEAAQTLGVKNGRLDVFSSRPAANGTLMPTVVGGVGGDGAMIRLQWRSGN